MAWAIRKGGGTALRRSKTEAEGGHGQHKLPVLLFEQGELKTQYQREFLLATSMGGKSVAFTILRIKLKIKLKRTTHLFGGRARRPIFGFPSR
jgi:hypothetical protein